MDGRKSRLSPHKMLITLAALALATLSSATFGQAMGSLTIDSPSTTETPVVASPATAPAVTQAPVVPLIVAPQKNVGVEHAVPAADLAAAPAPKAAPVADTNLPAAAAASNDAVPLSKIEEQSIKPRTPDAVPTASPTKPTTSTGSISSGYSSALQVATALTVVVGLIFIGKALAKKFVPGAKGGSGKGVIEVLARYPLCKNQSLVLVRIGTQLVALNQAKDQSQSVLVISDQVEVAKIMGQIEGQSRSSSTAGFNRLLSNARMDLTDEANHPEREEPISENLDEQLEEMAAAKRQLMELRHQVRSVRDRMPS